MKTNEWMSKKWMILTSSLIMFLAPGLFAQQISTQHRMTTKQAVLYSSDTNQLFTEIPYESEKVNFGSIYLGNNAGHTNHLGFDNIFIGENAGKKNSSGYDNTFIGKGAGMSNDWGNANTFIGKSAGYSNTTGYYNTFLGRDAGAFNTNGNNNTFIGRNSGGFHRQGDSNTFLGAEAGLMNENGHGNVFIGYKAGYNSTGNQQLFIDNSDTQTPLIWGDFDKDRVGINRIAKTNTLEINGTASKSTPGNWSGVADKRVMQNVQALKSQDMLEKVLQINGIAYDLESGGKTVSTYGFEGSNLAEVRPDLVKTNAEGYIEAAYGDMDPMLVEAVKALNAKIQALETENEILKQQLKSVDELKAEVKAIRDIMTANNR